MLLQVKDVLKSYGHKKVLKGLSFEVNRGRIVGLLGSNGCGKSTIIKAINGLLTIDGGQILVNGQKVGLESKRVISYLPEQTYLDLSLNAKHAMQYFHDFYEDFDMDKAEKMLTRLNIDLTQKIKTMSKGTKEKVQLSLVLARKADLYIFDEPIGGVDPASRDFILKMILDNFNQEGSIILSTHLISDIESILDDIIFIKDGQVVLTGEADQLRQEHQKSIDQIFRGIYAC